MSLFRSLRGASALAVAGTLAGATWVAIASVLVLGLTVGLGLELQTAWRLRRARGG